jgi:hypothetical protein
MVSARLRCVAASAVLIAVVAARANAAGTGVIRGAESVNVRAAPSLDGAAFAALQKGTSVRVERVVGAWALITLPGGRQGYVKAAFVDLPADVERVEIAEPTPASPANAAPVAVAPAAPVVDPARQEALEQEVAHLRDRLAAIESSVATPGSAQSDDAAAARRIADAEPTYVAGAPLPTAIPPAEPQEIGPSLALAGVGLVLGFLIGAAYGQRQERNRRTRVRF